MKDTKKYEESRQLPEGGYLHKNRVEPESSAGAPSISSMSQNKENNVNEYKERLLEKILEPTNLNLAYKKVRANKGSSGVDGMTVDDLLEFLTPEGVVGKPSLATRDKAKRPIAAILEYLTLTVNQILEAFPAGTVPPVEKVSLRTKKEMEPFLKEPLSDGWKSVYELPHIGPFQKL